MTKKKPKRSEFSLEALDVVHEDIDQLVARNPLEDTKRRSAAPPAEELKRTTVKLPLSVHTRLKVLAAREKTTVFALLHEGALSVLEKHGG